MNDQEILVYIRKLVQQEATPRLIDLEKLADLLGCSYSYLRRTYLKLFKECGITEYYKIGNQVCITDADYRQILERNKINI